MNFSFSGEMDVSQNDPVREDSLEKDLPCSSVTFVAVRSGFRMYSN